MILNSIAKIKDYLSLAQKGETNLTEQDKTNLRTMVDQEAESKFANSKARGKDVKLLNAPPKIVHR